MKIEIDSTERALLEGILSKVKPSAAAVPEGSPVPIVKPSVSDFDVSALAAKYGEGVKIRSVLPFQNPDGSWVCTIKTAAGKVRREALKVRPAGVAGANAAPKSLGPAQKKPLRETWDPSSPMATAESRDLVLRAAANLNRMNTPFAPAADWYLDFINSKTPQQRAAILAPHLAGNPVPNGNWVIATGHLRALLAAIEPKPDIGELIATGRYAEAWKLDPGIRAEFGSFEGFAAYHRHTIAGQALAKQKAEQEREAWLSSNVTQLPGNKFTLRRPDPMAAARAAEKLAEEREVSPGRYVARRRN